jgi:hypothetical protein
MKQILVEFIPIILIFLLLTYTEKMILWSNTSLGKIIILLIILFYTSLDKLYGILVTLLFILFYQSDCVENMLNNNKIENFEPKLDTVTTHTALKPLEPVSYTDQYELPKINTESAKEFRQQHCEKGHLVNKGQKVKIDIADHVYPEIMFENEKCNICDPTCSFSVIEKQIEVTEKIRPISGR